MPRPRRRLHRRNLSRSDGAGEHARHRDRPRLRDVRAARFAAALRVRWRDVLLLQRWVPEEILGRSGVIRHSREGGNPAKGSRVWAGSPPSRGRHVYLPHAPRDPPARARHVSQVRHGARAGDAVARRGRESRARGFPAAILGDASAHDCHLRHRDGRVRGQRGPIPSRLARGAVGRLAVPRALGRFDPHAQSEHVDAHRHRRARRLHLQRGRHRRSRAHSCAVFRERPGRPSISKRPRSSSRSR